jgi:hypothetical protein
VGFERVELKSFYKVRSHDNGPTGMASTGLELFFSPRAARQLCKSGDLVLMREAVAIVPNLFVPPR